MNKELKDLMEGLFPDRMLSLRQCALLSGLASRQVREKCLSGEISYYNHGRKSMRVRWADLQTYLKDSRVEAVVEVEI